MSIKFTLVGLTLVLILLVACAQGDEQPQREAAAPGPTLPATPTLLPGLPTSTPWTAADADGGQEQGPLASATPSPSPTPTSSPTATPLPAERLDLGRRHLENENFAAAADQYQAGLLSGQLTEEQRQEALLALGQAQLADGQDVAANETLGALLAETAGNGSSSQASDAQDRSGTEIASAYYYLAQSYGEQGECEAAIGAYQAYLEQSDVLAAYIQPMIANCHLALGDRQAAIAAFEAAVASAAQPAVLVPLHYRLAELYLEDGNYPAAVEQYDAVLEMAKQPGTLGEATYLAGTAELLAGNPEAGYRRYLEAVQKYPEAYQSYQSLVALIEAGYEIDDFQRGLIDYYAKAYEPAVTVLARYVESPGDHNEDAHLYLAWSLEGLGNIPAALEQLQVYVDAHLPEQNTLAAEGIATPNSTESPSPASSMAAARGTIEKARVMARAGMTQEAAESYLSYVETFPDGEDGPFAAWWSAAIAEQMGDFSSAIERYELLAELYPEHEDADEALFRAGYLSYQDEDFEQAQSYWEEGVTRYPSEHYGAAALVWLLRLVSDDDRATRLSQAGEYEGSTYYPLRVRHILSDTEPFEPAERLDLELSLLDQRTTESWLREELELETGANLAELAEELAADGRLIRGEQLWHLGLRQEAKRELESLRTENVDDPLASYQLALFFRDLGLYRSSILAATSVMNELEIDVLDAPRFIAGLAYPTYYSDLIAAGAQNYGYDPLLQFALVRQESLFESFATSGAAAQGLSQVIPDTGAYIAQRLGWVDFVNEDLYRPYVGIAFGAFYLDQQIDAFNGDIAAALSAYNAGPGNAARWFGEAGGDIDHYVETVDFSETRQYIERIYAGHAIYRHLYGDS